MKDLLVCPCVCKRDVISLGSLYHCQARVLLQPNRGLAPCRSWKPLVQTATCTFERSASCLAVEGARGFPHPTSAARPGAQQELAPCFRVVLCLGLDHRVSISVEWIEHVLPYGARGLVETPPRPEHADGRAWLSGVRNCCGLEVGGLLWDRY